jgi:prolipoprotein diacylglyceryltransferase
MLLLLVRRNVRPGVLAIAYVVLYAVSQLILFEFRKSEPPGPLGLREAQWTSIAMLVLGAPLLYLLWLRTNDRLEKRFPAGPAAGQEPATGQEPAAAR